MNIDLKDIIRNNEMFLVRKRKSWILYHIYQYLPDY